MVYNVEYLSEFTIFYLRYFGKLGDFMDLDNMIKLKDFADERNIPDSTVRKYINTHKADFDGHIHHDKVNKNTLYLDDVAVSILSKKYKLSTEIITNSELLERVEATNDMVMALGNKILQLTEERELVMTKAIESKELENKILALTEEVQKLRAEKEIERLETEKLRLERNSMIDMNYLQLVHHINKLRRERLDK